MPLDTANGLVKINGCNSVRDFNFSTIILKTTWRINCENQLAEFCALGKANGEHGFLSHCQFTGIE